MASFLPAAAWAAHTALPPVPDVIAPAELSTLQPAFIDRSDAPAGAPNANGASASAPAPMPDNDAVTPIAGTDAQPEVSPAFYRPQKTYRGDGFSRGSSAEALQSRDSSSAAGLALNVPLN